MKRSELLGRQLAGRMDAIQTCRDVVEGNINAMLREGDIGPHDVRDVDLYELMARIFTDLEILAMNQASVGGFNPGAQCMGDMLIGVDPADENDYREPSSAAR